MAIPTPTELVRVLDARPGYIFSDQELARHFHLHHRADLYELADILEDLIDQGQILYLDGHKGGGFTSVLSAKEAEGVLDYVSARRAFAIVENVSPDIVLRPDRLLGALHGDKIRVRYMPAYGEDEKPEGQVLQVLERARTRFVGTLRASGRRLFLEPEMKRMWEEIHLEPGAEADAKPGDKIVVEVTQWAPDGGNLVGRVVERLGVAGTHKAEMLGILSEFGLPEAFPEEVEAEANQIKPGITKAEVAKRRDMRAITTFTIDPIDAKDFDDALSIRKLDNGRWEIGVHIADVTHYVREGTALEAEALRRATSVYLVDRVVPMLPERLSNELCSLRPHEDKLTFSAVFELDEDGRVHNPWYGRTVIHSDRRFSYEQVQEMLEGAEGDFKEEVLTLNRLAYKLREGRFSHGAVSFETPELRFVLDAEGKPVKVVPKVRKDAHKLIEDFMLLANKYVAEYVYALKADGLKTTGPKRSLAQVAALPNRPNPMVYRVHEPPDGEKIEQLRQFVSRFGHRLATESGNLQTALNKLSSDTESRPEGAVIAQFAVRSMMKARYTVDPLGHFGLGYKHYTHFTSPIRRYPDMLAHRCLAAYLQGKFPEATELLEKSCKHSSEMEKRAADAERASIKYKQVEFMMERIGQEFEGLVSGLTEWGLYVEIVDTACEGMVRLADIRDDHYVYDPERLTITGRRRGRRFQFGDRLRVRVKDANLLKRTLDLELADQAPATRHDRGRDFDRWDKAPKRPGSQDRAQARRQKNGGKSDRPPKKRR